MRCKLLVVVAAAALHLSSPEVKGDTVNFGRLYKGTSAADIDTTPTFPGQIQGINLGNNVEFGLLTGNETVGGVVLQNEPTAFANGITVNGPAPANRGIAGQAPPNLGATADDNALERVFNFGEYSKTAAGFNVSFPVTAGEKYKVTSLFFEFISLTRTFDITIDGVLAVDEFSVIQNDGLHQDALSGVSTTSFSAYEAIVTATGSSLVVGFGSGGSLGLPHPLSVQDPVNFGTLKIEDVTPFVQGIIVERVPEPSTYLLALAGSACIAWRRTTKR
jgi:hypothetical protein